MSMRKLSRGNIEPVTGSGSRRFQEFAVFKDEVDSPLTEGHQSILWRGSWTKRRRPEHKSMLEFGLRVAQQGHHEPGAATEAAEDCPLANLGLAGERVHGQRFGAELGHQIPGSVEQSLAIPRCVTALVGRA